MWSNTPLCGGSLPDKTVCLTFDDGPAKSATLELAHYLTEQNISAAFFLVGKHMVEFAQTAEQLRSLGHIIGNHSSSHPHLNATHLSDRVIVSEVLETSALLRQVSADDRKFTIPFRPPYGDWNPHLTHLMNSHPDTAAEHVGPILWDFCADDFQFWRDGKSPEACSHAYTAQILQSRRRSGIVLCHDRTADDPKVISRTPEMIRHLVPQLRDAGVTFSGLFDVPAIRRQIASSVLKAV